MSDNNSATPIKMVVTARPGILLFTLQLMDPGEMSESESCVLFCSMKVVSSWHWTKCRSSAGQIVGEFKSRRVRGK
jgi:hypothetical protein